VDREEWNRRYAGTELLWTATPNRHLVGQVRGMAVGRALDLACGEGRNAVWLAGEGWEVTAVDFSDVALAKGRELAHSQGVDVEWIEADVRTYVARRSAYDLVVLLYLHLLEEDRRVVYAHAASALSPEGTLLVVGHDLRNLAEGVGGPRDPEVLYSPVNVAHELPEELAVEVVESVERPVEVDGRERVAIEALVRARRL
jgi:2-polyprenyl-3-methyl-5-hydroxy-6-metoxy-1,4-benzoquinol methylase